VHGRRTSWRLEPSSSFFVAISSHFTLAQVTIFDGDLPWICCDTCWRGYDSVLSHFSIGAVDFNYADSAAAWGLDFTIFYGRPDLARLDRIIATPGIDHPCENPFVRYLDTLTSRQWKRADSVGFGIVANLGPITATQLSTRRQEWHPGGTGRIELATATRGYWSDSVRGSHGSVLDLPSDQPDSARFGQIGVPKLPRATVPALTRVMEGNAWSAGEVFFPGNPAPYDSQGREDRSLIFRATVSFRTDTNE